jgi:dihydroxyacetone kinase-like protein
VALKTATHPQSGDAIFDLADDEMEIGMGQHGEAGTGSSKVMTADDTAKVMVTQLAKAVDANKGDRLMVIINGAGATTMMEMCIVLRGVKKVLDELGIEIACSRVGEFLTVQEMGGFQMFVAKMDDELIDLWNAPCDTPALTVQ